MRRLVCLLLLLASFTAQAATFNVGNTSVFTSADANNSNLLLASKTPISQAGTINSLSFYVTTVGGQLYLGIYSDNAGVPGTLLATTAVFTPVVGWNTKSVLTPVSLAVGTYWLAYHPSSNALGFVKSDVVGGSAFYTRTFAALPSTFGQPFSTTSSQWSFYATLTTIPTGPVNGTPGAPTVGLSQFGSMSFAWDAPVVPAGSPVTIAGYRLYVSTGTGASGCPGASYVSAIALTATYPHLSWGISHSGQVTTIGSDGGESACSNVATGQPK